MSLLEDRSMFHVGIRPSVLPREFRAAVGLVLLASGCGGGSGDPPTPPAPIVSVAITPGNLVLSGAGATGSFSVQVATTAGIVTNPTVTWSTDNAGVANVVGSGSSATVTAVAPGTTIVRATSGGVVGTAAVLVSAPAIALSAAPISIAQATTTTTSVVITRSNFSGAVSLAFDPPVAGITVQFTGAPEISGNTERRTISIAVASTVAPGVYALTVRGTGTGVAAVSTSLNLTVLPAIYTLAVVPNTIAAIAGSASASAVVRVARTNFAFPVALTASGAPPGVTVALAPATASGDSAVVSVAAAAGTTPGTYPITIRGTVPQFSDRTTTLLVSVAAAPAASNTLTGVWTGTGLQNNPGISWSVLLTYSGGPLNSVVATVAYPSLTCGGTWTLRAIGSDTVRVRETITFGNCVDSDYTVRVLPNGRLDFRGPGVAVPIFSEATLDRASDTSGPSLGAFSTMWRGTAFRYTNPIQNASMDLGLVDGRVGSIVGSIAYPTHGCGGPLRLVRASVTEIEVTEQLTYGNCVTPASFTLSRGSTGFLLMQWRRVGGLLETMGALGAYSLPFPSGPADPGLPTAVVSPGRVVLTWVDRSSAETGFVIERSTAGGPFLPIAGVLNDVTTYTDQSVVAGTRYSYRIRALDPRSGALGVEVTITAQ
jgi:hypothetical protein